MILISSWNGGECLCRSKREHSFTYSFNSFILSFDKYLRAKWVWLLDPGNSRHVRYNSCPKELLNSYFKNLKQKTTRKWVSNAGNERSWGGREDLQLETLETMREMGFELGFKGRVRLGQGCRWKDIPGKVNDGSKGTEAGNDQGCLQISK